MEEQVNDYSLSFELEDTDESLQLSSEEEIPDGIKNLKEDRSVAPISSKPPRPPSSDGSVKFARTIRSPLAMSKLMNQDRVSSSAESQSSAPHSPSPARLKFKQVAGTVQQMQSTTKKFKNSKEIRDVAFKEWLTKKEVKDINEKVKLAASKETEDEKAREQERQIEMAQRAAQKVKDWRASKEMLLQSKKKLEAEERERAEREAEEKLMRSREGKAAAEKWREEKDSQLSQKAKERKKMEKEAVKRKEEEREEKRKENQQAFQSWSQRKDEVLKEKARKKKEESKKLEITQKQSALQRRESSLESFTAWKSKKDERIKSTKTLFTYKSQTKIHEKSWCPARSMQYTYPTSPSKDSLKSKGSKPSSSNNCSKSSSIDMDTYSAASFESEAAGSVTSSSGSESDSSELVESSHSASFNMSESLKKTGRQKTIQVCCQTLEYWCVCDH